MGRLGRTVLDAMTAWKRSLVVGAAVLAGSAGVAVPVLGAKSGSPASRGAPDRTSASNHAAARRDIKRLLARLNLPPGVTRSAQEPAGDGGLLKNPPSYPATPNLVAGTRWWTTQESSKQVLSYVKAHPPKGGNQDVSGSQGQCTPHTSPPTGCHTVSEMIGFSFPSISGVLGFRALLVEVTRLKDGSTGIRVDAQAVWISARPARERVPSGVRVIDVVQAVHGQPPTLSRTVSKRRQVRKIVALIDRLPITQPGVTSCPPEAGNPPIDTFTFRPSKSGPALARASVSAEAGNSTTGCDAMGFSINGHSEPSLGRPQSFLEAVGRLLGVRLTSRPPQ